MSTTGMRERDADDSEGQRLAKRFKVVSDVVVMSEPVQDVDMEPADVSTSQAQNPLENLLPPSRSLLPYKRPENSSDGVFRILEPDVGISEYIASDVPKIEGIIKQRFTDFLVFEVDIQGDVVHLKSIDKPESTKASVNSANEAANQSSADAVTESGLSESTFLQSEIDEVTAVESGFIDATTIEPRSGSTTSAAPTEDIGPCPWPSRFTEALSPLLSTLVIEQLKEMFLQGPEPPLISDNGWTSRGGVLESSDTAEPSVSGTAETQVPSEVGSLGKKDKDRRSGRGKGGRGRSGRGGRGAREDHRRVTSDSIPSKQTRTALHEIVRGLFNGKLETETAKNDADDDGAQRIVIKWSKSKGSSAKRGSKEDAISRGGRGNPFPYIHFTMQKTNRDTQDALSHIARLLHVSAKDLSTAGTKDKRGVTTQRVSLRRNGKTIEDVWNVVNGLTGRRSRQQAVSERGERGVRIADLSYRKSFLELGMLKGNAFVITLRNVKVDSVKTMDRALQSLKENGFINYYGMQRFGTASIPTHSIGLALLRSDWTGAVSLILRPRPGEYADAEAARRAWLDERDLDKALSLMPRRVVAERCILESYKKQKGDDRNALGAISTIPKNLRLIYIHAYQSYVWNAIVSERLNKYGHKPIVGDLVFEVASSAKNDIDEQSLDPTVEAEDGTGTVNDEENEKASSQLEKKGKVSWQPPRVKVLTGEDLDKYSIFDVIMPLPGTDVAYPEGLLGEKYKEFLRLDGLDPNNFKRKQRDYTLGGSYRKILHLPKNLSWSVMSYTDPEVALAQSDEDALLGFDPPLTDENGQFMALQIRMQLGTAAYATMALREVTKAETSSHHQSTLTQAADDQKFRRAGEDEAT